jgi:hypothetical protein
VKFAPIYTGSINIGFELGGKTMKIKNFGNIFIVWNSFQRRAQSLGRLLNIEVRYYHYLWEEKGFFQKACSYLLKSVYTTIDLIRNKPNFIFIQLAPTPLLYIASVYCLLTRSKCIADCHNTMLYDSHWIKWPFARLLLSRCYLVLVHNQDVKRKANDLGISASVLRDPLPNLRVNPYLKSNRRLPDLDEKYVIVPGSMSVDEPIEELFIAAREFEKIKFYLTWYIEKVPENLRLVSPKNIHYTGFLNESDFNQLYANATAAIVLTTREGTQPSGASEAIALEVPLVISDIQTTRKLYKNSAIYVKNESHSIKCGIRKALENKLIFSSKIAGLKGDFMKESEEQITEVRRLLTVV